MAKPLILLASDHRGFRLKSEICAWLKERNVDFLDLGPDGEDRCDASDFALRVIGKIKDDPKCIGVLICGTGQAMAMTSNRFQHIRAALCTNTTMARLAREHNDANILVMGAHITGLEVALDCMDVFLKTKFLEGRFVARREKLTDMGGL
ncbi:MAG: ribose 5-phosphate isomerase B [Alphaproteobacteria bacterium]|nr:ribose 5-phosphate isomerase B [Alphaproteobacteria bacterium]